VENFHSRTVHLDTIKVLLPTDAQENCFKRSIKIDIHGSVHHNTHLIEMTNKMQLCRTIFYLIFP